LPGFRLRGERDRLDGNVCGSQLENEGFKRLALVAVAWLREGERGGPVVGAVKLSLEKGKIAVNASGCFFSSAPAMMPCPISSPGA